jgi:hypothetical protein
MIPVPAQTTLGELKGKSPAVLPDLQLISTAAIPGNQLGRLSESNSGNDEAFTS